MKRFIFTIIVAAVSMQGLQAQFNLSFYQMQDATPQNNNNNPAVFPRCRAFVSLPIISGMGFSVNNSFNSNDIFTETGDSVLIDIDKFLDSQDEGAYLNTNLAWTDLMFGFRTGDNGFVTVFANDRVDVTLRYPLQWLKFAWKGNAEFVGEEFRVDDITYTATWYREMGIGYGRTFSILGKDTDLGLRLKYLNGIAHGSIEDHAEMSLLTRDEDYSVLLTLEKGVTRTAGVEPFRNEDYQYYRFNRNGGFGVDLGAQMQLTDKMQVGFSAVDLGFINWKDNAEIAKFDGASFELEGRSFDDVSDLAVAFIDSLKALDIDTVEASFRTNLHPKIFLSGSYEVTNGGYAQATLSNYIVQGTMRSALGIGYVQKVGNWLSTSVTLSASSQAGFDVGGGLMIRGAIFQFYVTADNILNTINLPEARGAYLTAGLNFIFGRPVKAEWEEE